MSGITDEELDEWERLSATAPGPWYVISGAAEVRVDEAGVRGIAHDPLACTASDDQTARLIAEAVCALPRLIAELRRERAEKGGRGDE